tara:strand:- start:6225 stop:6599 length:375 start_codon:yes stop_codon:yes gene_type:complete
MPSKEKSKGTYHENKIKEWLDSLGVVCTKQIASGQHGHLRADLRSDITISLQTETLYVECKYRNVNKKSRFPNIWEVLENNDIAIFKKSEGGKNIKQIVLMNQDVFEKYTAPELHKHRKELEND